MRRLKKRSIFIHDVGTEELAHLEMVGAMVTQLTQGATVADMRNAGLDPYYADHGLAVFPQSAAGIPWSAMSIQSKGDPIADLYENLAAEQKAKATYENLLDLVGNEPEVANPIKFLREREVVHFQRFGECIQKVEDYLSSRRMFYAK